MRILVADDERDLAEALEAMLKREHYSVDVVYDGQDAPDYGLAEGIAIAAVVLIHRWKHSTLLSIGTGTVLYMLLVQYVF